jgi:hypothetical protein
MRNQCSDLLAPRLVLCGLFEKLRLTFSVFDRAFLAFKAQFSGYYHVLFLSSFWQAGVLIARASLARWRFAFRFFFLHWEFAKQCIQSFLRPVLYATSDMSFPLYVHASI